MGHITELLHICCPVNAMDAFSSHLEENGLKSSDGPTESSSGSTFAFVDAPEGYGIELIQQANS